jgi:hypothetical protein
MHQPFPVLGVVLILLGMGGLVCGLGLLPGMGPGMMRGPAGWGMMGGPRGGPGKTRDASNGERLSCRG